MKASLKYLEGTKWKHLNMKECIGSSIAYIMSKEDRVCVAALLNDKDEPQFFLTNNKEQYDKYIQKTFTLMVDDLILLLGSEVIPSHPVAHAAIQTFPDGKFEVLLDERKEGDTKKWW